MMVYIFEELPKGLLGRINGNNVYLSEELNSLSLNQSEDLLHVDIEVHLLKKSDNWYFISAVDPTVLVNKADIEVVNLLELSDSEVEIRKTPDLDGEIIGYSNESYLIGVTGLMVSSLKKVLVTIFILRTVLYGCMKIILLQISPLAGKSYKLS